VRKGRPSNCWEDGDNDGTGQPTELAGRGEGAPIPDHNLFVPYLAS
jgi:hypothetical protein